MSFNDALFAAAAGGGAAPYLGQVATRCYMPDLKSTGGTTQSMNRTRHYARDAITSLQLVFPNWSGIGEVAPGATADVTASIEYPVGTFTQALFSGSAAGTIANGGQIVSDEIAVSIPDGSEFFVRSFYECSAGFPFSSRGRDAANGDVLAYAVSGLVDRTMSNPMPANMGTGLLLTPSAIIATTRKASVMMWGDSRCSGYTDTPTGTSGDTGQIARSIGPELGYINAGIPNERTVNFIAGHANRLALSAYCSHVICEYGINDFATGSTPSDVYSRLATLRGYVSDLPFYQTTLTPVSTSTDGWATTVNQTTSAYNANRVSMNALIRANGNGFNGVYEVADEVETARDSGIWLAPGYTTDGVHETNTANIAIQASGVIDPSALTR